MAPTYILQLQDFHLVEDIFQVCYFI